MANLPAALSFVCMTFLAWGSYGILLHHGQELLHGSSMRSFVGVGIAYFLVAVLVPAFLMSNRQEKGKWTFGGTMLSLFAGSVGALGAFGVLLALKFGKPLYVMPLVFGFAPVVNTLVTTWLNKSFQQITPVFIVGILMVAGGAVGVLVTKPRPAPVVKEAAETDKGKDVEAKASKKANVEAASDDIDSETTGKEESVEDEETKEESKDKKEKKKKSSKSGEAESEASAVASESSSTDLMKIVLSIVLAAVCWGSYGPFLHIGQMKMGGSRLRPFFCVGMAYFAIAVVAPLVFLSYVPEQGDWTLGGMTWSIAAGAAGAVGALGIIMAFNFGGKPIYVMPLIFGFAPVVNTLITVYLANSFHAMKPEFLICMGIVILGAVTVLLFAPKAKPHGPALTPPVPPAPTN